MNLPISLFVGLLLLLVLFAVRSPRYLFAIWPFAVLAMPTVRVMIGPAPVYVYDVVTALLLARLLAGHELRRWPREIPHWHWWFIGVGLLFGTLVPTVRYGFAPEMVWIFLHTALAWMAFAIGIALFVSPRAGQYREMLAHGVLAGIVYGAVIAALQFGDPAMAEAINAFHFRDMPEHLVVRLEDVSGILSSSRVNGPHGGPNSFGGTTAIAAAVGLLLYGTKKMKLALLVVGLGAFTIALTVSRQVLVATILAVAMAGLLARFSQQLRLAGVVILLAIAAVASGSMANWGERLGRWEGGLGQDINVVGRVIIGPQRLIELISREPSVLLTGVGLDVQKLVEKSEGKAGDVGFLQSGFVSNSFLLSLYFLGIAGFVLTISFWIWVAGKAWGRPRSTRPLDVGVVTMAILLIASDNYAFLAEITVTMLFLLAAIVAGRWWSVRVVLRRRRHSQLQSRNAVAASHLS